MPNDVALLDMMLDWVPDEKIRNLIFVENPAELFGFPPLIGVPPVQAPSSQVLVERPWRGTSDCVNASSADDCGRAHPCSPSALKRTDRA